MAETKRRANLIGLLPIGFGLIAVGIATRNYGLMGAGVVFAIIGGFGVKQYRDNRDTSRQDDEQGGGQ